MRADRSATTAARLLISGWSLRAAGSDVLPGSSRVDSGEVDVDVDGADHGAQRYQDQKNDKSDEHADRRSYTQLTSVSD